MLDMVQALLYCVYTRVGVAETESLVHRIIRYEAIYSGGTTGEKPSEASKDYTTELQELTQKLDGVLPEGAILPRC